jgi:hypothetical protein
MADGGEEGRALAAAAIGHKKYLSILTCLYLLTYICTYLLLHLHQLIAFWGVSRSSTRDLKNTGETFYKNNPSGSRGTSTTTQYFFFSFSLSPSSSFFIAFLVFL